MGSGIGGSGVGGSGSPIDPATLKTVPLQPDASPKLKLQLPLPPQHMLLPAAQHADPPSQTLVAVGVGSGSSAASSAANSVTASPAPSAPATPEQHHELVSVAVEVPAQPLPQALSAAPPPPGYTQTQEGLVDPKSGYGYHRPQYVVVQPSRVYIEDDATCAQCGCALALCFPIVGCITYCVNADAPFGTQRRKWARLALTTALITFLLGFLLVWFTSAPEENR